MPRTFLFIFLILGIFTSNNSLSSLFLIQRALAQELATQSTQVQGTIEEIIPHGDYIYLTINTYHNFSVRLPITNRNHLLSVDSKKLPWEAMFPGDGIKLNTDLDKKGIVAATLLAEPGSGRILFVSDQKITFQNGKQFLINNKAHLWLDGKALTAAGQFDAGQKVAYRVNLYTGEIGWLEGWTKKEGRIKKEELASPQIKIHYFSNKITLSNQTIKIKISGEPKAKLTAALSGVIASIPFKEKKAGQYVAAVTVPNNIYLKESWILIKDLTIKNKEKLVNILPVSIITKPNSGHTEFYPKENDKLKVNTPFIYVNFLSKDVPLNVSTFRFILDGKNITQKTHRSPAFICYYPSNPLSIGSHHVFVSVKDESGKEWIFKWKFYILPELQ